MRINPVANIIKKNKPVQNMFKYANKNPTLFNSMAATTVATTIRPVGIQATPGNKENKRYFTARSYITGLLDLATSAMYYIPINKIAKKVEKKLLKNKNTVFFNNKTATNAIKMLINRGSYFIAIPIQSALMFWAIPKIVKKIFGDKK